MAPKKMTEYERKRLENIRRNDEMLAALKIRSKASDLTAASKRPRLETKSYKLNEKKKPKPENPVVIRRSLRTRGIAPVSDGLTDDIADSAKKISNSITQVSPLELSPDEMGPLSFTDAYTGTKSDRAFIKTILNCSGKGENFVKLSETEMKPEFDIYAKEENDGVKDSKNENIGGNSDLGACDLIKGVEKNEIKLVEEAKSCIDLESLTLKPENIARIVPGRIMVVKFFPCSDMRMVVAGSKSGNVGFWNLDSKEEENDGIYLYHTHRAPISGIVFQQSCLSKIYTSCYDGLIRLMDAEKEVFDLVYSSDYSVYSLCQQPNNANSLYFSEGSGGLDVWDIRTGKHSDEWLLHGSRINTIDFNPQNLNIMATSSSDQTVCLWDLRSMSSDKPKPLRALSHKKAVHSAYFSPSGSSFATTSADDTVGIWSGANFEEAMMISHNNQTGRWISSFRAIWGWDDSYIFVGNMKRGVDVISPAQRRIITTLQSAEMTAIPCRFHAHPYQVGTLAAATSGGQIYMWTSSSL